MQSEASSRRKPGSTDRYLLMYSWIPAFAGTTFRVFSGVIVGKWTPAQGRGDERRKGRIGGKWAPAQGRGDERRKGRIVGKWAPALAPFRGQGRGDGPKAKRVGPVSARGVTRGGRGG